jgi:hypothetical protein
MLEEGFGLEDWRAGKALASARAPAWASQFLVLSARWAGSRQDVGGERLASRAPKGRRQTRLAALPPSSLVNSSQVKSSPGQSSQIRFKLFFTSAPRLPGSSVRFRNCEDREAGAQNRAIDSDDRQPPVSGYCT